MRTASADESLLCSSTSGEGQVRAASANEAAKGVAKETAEVAGESQVQAASAEEEINRRPTSGVGQVRAASAEEAADNGKDAGHSKLQAQMRSWSTRKLRKQVKLVKSLQPAFTGEPEQAEAVLKRRHCYRACPRRATGLTKALLQSMLL